MNKINRVLSHPLFLTLSRVLIGLVFLVSSLDKLPHPVEGFMAAVRGYHLLPELFLRPFSLILPWIELFTGAFMIFGLFYRFSTAMAGGLLLLLTAVIGATLLRGIPLDDCGCFKSFGIKESGPVALTRNFILLLVWLNLFRLPDPGWSADRFFQDHP